MLEHYDIRKKLEMIFVMFLFLFAVVYAIYRVYPVLTGPSLIVYYPTESDYVASTTFELSGKVSRVKEITLQGRPIPIDTDGHFKELLVANPPYTILVLTATDFYGKTVTKTLRVIPH
jgi:hypothetical protein